MSRNKGKKRISKKGVAGGGLKEVGTVRVWPMDSTGEEKGYGAEKSGNRRNRGSDQLGKTIGSFVDLNLT